MNSNANPYSPPDVDVASREPSVSAAKPHFRWRVIPAFVVGALGVLSFAFGLVAVAIMIIVLARDRDASLLPEMLAGCCIYLGFGGSWTASGVFLWKSQYRNAILAAAIGIAVPAVLLALFSP